MLHHLGSAAFVVLSSQAQTQILQVIIQAFDDKMPAVRQAAFRAGGTLIRSELSHSHGSFVTSLAQNLSAAADDSVLSVREV